MELYHEKQVAALCGVHCLNTLLQGPYFNEIDLAQIAHGLDELERALIGDGALGEASGNVAMDGMFSIQVLSRALESWGLQVVSLESEEARAYKAAPTTAEAFICNLQDHWFTLRRVAGGEWWNFNSLFPAPQPLSTFYLQAFLDTLRGEGWTIFVVIGRLPVTQPGSLEQQHNTSGRWWTPEDARAATDEAERARKRGRVTAALEGALARAEQQGGRLQLRTRGAAGGGSAAAAAGGGGGGTGAYGNAADDDGDVGGFGDDEDADLAAAIAASLQQSYPGAGAGGGSGGAAGDVAGAGFGSQQQQEPSTGPGRSGPGQSGQQGGEGGAGAGAAVGLPYGMYGGDEEDDDPELAMAIAASLADAAAAAGPGPGPSAAAGGDAVAGSSGDSAGAAVGVQEPQQQQQAPEPALGPEPDEGEGVIEVAFRLPTGSRCSRRFALTDPSCHLFSFVGPLMSLTPSQVALSTSFPKKDVASSPSTSLGELGLTHRTLLVAEPRR